MGRTPKRKLTFITDKWGGRFRKRDKRLPTGVWHYRWQRKKGQSKAEAEQAAIAEWTAIEAALNAADLGRPKLPPEVVRRRRLAEALLALLGDEIDDAQAAEDFRMYRALLRDKARARAVMSGDASAVTAPWDAAYDRAVADHGPLPPEDAVAVPETTGPTVPTAGTMGHAIDAYVARFVELAKGNPGKGSRAHSVQTAMAEFGEWFCRDKPVAGYNEMTHLGYYDALRLRIGHGIRESTAHTKWATVRGFVKHLHESAILETLPRNYASTMLRFRVANGRRDHYSVDDVKEILQHAPERIRLYVLLALNCGFNGVDIALLRPDKVDWTSGRIRHKRIKTQGIAGVPEVDYVLWPETFRLLQKHRARQGEYVLLSRQGECLITRRQVQGGNKDTISKAFRRLTTKHGIRGSFRWLRATAGHLVANHAGEFVADHMLGHAPNSIGRDAYFAVDTEKLDQAVLWLGRELGVLE